MRRGRKQATLNNKRQSGRGAKNTRAASPRTVEEFFAMPKPIQDIYIRVTHAISKMRTDDVSLPQAAQDYGVNRHYMQRFGGKALRKRPNGRYVAKAIDHLLRVLPVPTL